MPSRWPIALLSAALVSAVMVSAALVSAVMVSAWATSPAPAQSSPPPPIPPVLSVTDLGIVHQNPAVLERDGTYSAAINGVSYWAFNDTALTQANASGQNFFSNSLSWTGLDASAGITLDHDQLDTSFLPTQFIPFTASEAGFNYSHNPAHCTGPTCGEGLAIWPGPVVYNPANGQVIIPFGLIIRGGPIIGFHAVGSGLSVGTVNADGTLAMIRPAQTGGPAPTLMWSRNETAYTDQAFIYNGYYYAYGGHNVFVTTQDYLARVPVAQLLQKSAWTYYAGQERWSADPADGVPVFDGSAAGSSVFFDAFLDEWVAIYSGNFSNNIYYAVAAAPEGPWSAASLLAVGKAGFRNNADYAARAHSEFSPDGGKTEYVTYVHSTGAFGQNLPLLRVVFGAAR